MYNLNNDDDDDDDEDDDCVGYVEYNVATSLAVSTLLKEAT